MDSKEFFEKIIDGYLFHDLASMVGDVDTTGEGGGVGYPMLQTIASGIELFGAIISKNTFDPSGGRANEHHSNYWKILSKVNSRYLIFQDLFRALIRNGVAHMYIPKGPIIVTKWNHTSHLYRDKVTRDGITYDGYIVDVLSLHDDFKQSYILYLRPIIFDNVASEFANIDEINKRIQEILLSDSEKIQNIFDQINKQDVKNLINKSIGNSTSRESNASPQINFTRDVRLDPDK